MKKILFALVVITALFSCSKSNEEDFSEQKPKEYIVSLGMTGEILDIEESPLSRAEGDDLYGIQVYSRSNGDYVPYAYGLFDDKSKMSIKLLGGYEYKFEITMVVDGKNKLGHNNEVYFQPFAMNGNNNASLQNVFIYSNSEYFEFLNVGSTYLKEGIYKHPNAERFYGILSDYRVKENDLIKIDMKRVCFGVKFIAESLNEGKLKINMENAPELQISSNGGHEIQDIFTFWNNTYKLDWMQDGYTETIPVSIMWEKEDGAIIPLANKDITFKRNVLTTITIKVDDAFINNGIEISQEVGEMEKGEDIVLESGTDVDGDIDPEVGK